MITDERQKQRMAFCIMHVDGRGPNAAARACGVSPAEAMVLADNECNLRIADAHKRGVHTAWCDRDKFGRLKLNDEGQPLCKEAKS